MKLQLSKIRQPKSVLVVFGILALFTIATFIYLKGRKAHTPVLVQESSAVTYSTDNPSEEKPKDDYKWAGKADDPKYIRLSTIQTEGYIQNVGVDQHTQVAVPNNIHVAGWFTDSVRPGEKGLSIIDGHLNGLQKDGIFVHLQNLKKDDIFTVEFGNGTKKQFKVTDTVTVDTKEAANLLFSQNPNSVSQLNLITCGGNFDRSSRLYDKRVIVYSELVGSTPTP